MSDLFRVQGAVEGDLDEAVLRRIVAHVGAEVGVIYGRNGKARLRSDIVGYNQAARRSRWAVLVDLDHECDCAPALISDWLPQPSPLMCFRADRSESLRRCLVRTRRVLQRLSPGALQINEVESGRGTGWRSRTGTKPF